MNGDDPPCSQTDPLGLARFLKQKARDEWFHEHAFLTSTENTRVATTGSDRGASQPATNAVPTGGAFRPMSSVFWPKSSHVSLVGAVHGERWCFPGVGQSPDFLVPVRAFQAEEILTKYLAKLTKQQEGWALLRDEASGEPVLSPAPVSAFVGGDGRPYMYGSLARIANREGMVFVMFDHVSPPAHFEDIDCVDLDGVTTPPSDEDRFELS